MIEFTTEYLENKIDELYDILNIVYYFECNDSRDKISFFMEPNYANWEYIGSVERSIRIAKDMKENFNEIIHLSGAVERQIYHLEILPAYTPKAYFIREWDINKFHDLLQTKFNEINKWHESFRTLQGFAEYEAKEFHDKFNNYFDCLNWFFIINFVFWCCSL